uniref:Secreted protein n=1 Tax=Schistosoma mansoni TaxID=6183 RepID=A0A3Q0KV36_SCHMA
MLKSILILSILSIVFSFVNVKCAVATPESDIDRFPYELTYAHDELDPYYFPTLRDSLIRRLMKRKYYISQRLGK